MSNENRNFSEELTKNLPLLKVGTLLSYLANPERDDYSLEAKIELVKANGSEVSCYEVICFHGPVRYITSCDNDYSRWLRNLNVTAIWQACGKAEHGDGMLIRIEATEEDDLSKIIKGFDEH